MRNGTEFRCTRKCEIVHFFLMTGLELKLKRGGWGLRVLGGFFVSFSASPHLEGIRLVTKLCREM